MQGAVADVLSSRYSDAALVGPPETGGRETQWMTNWKKDLNRKASRNTNRHKHILDGLKLPAHNTLQRTSENFWCQAEAAASKRLASNPGLAPPPFLGTDLEWSWLLLNYYLNGGIAELHARNYYINQYKVHGMDVFMNHVESLLSPSIQMWPWTRVGRFFYRSLRERASGTAATTATNSTNSPFGP